MNIHSRRTFFGRFFAALLFTILPAGLVFSLLGCPSTTAIATFVSTIAKYGAQLATYFGAAGIATQITALAAQISTDIASWQAGSAASDAIQAINDMIDLINQIPFAIPYAGVIDLLLSALSGLLLLLPSSASLRSNAKRRSMNPFHYAGFGKKSMNAATASLDAQWKLDTAGLTLSR